MSVAADDETDFHRPASEATLQKVVAALEGSRVAARVVEARQDARKLVLDLVLAAA